MRLATAVLFATTLIAANARAQTPPAAAPSPSQMQEAPAGKHTASRPMAAPLRINLTVELDFHLGPGTRGCPEEPYLHQEVARQLGYDPLVPDPTRERIGRFKIEILRAPRGLTAKAVYTNLAGKILWDEPPEYYSNCKDVYKAIAFGIAAQLTVHAASTQSDEPQPPPAPVLKEEPLPVPPTKVEPLKVDLPAKAQPTQPNGWGVRGEIGLTMLGAFGMAPAPTIGGALQLGVALRPPGSERLWLLAGIEGRVDAPRTSDVDAVKTSLVAGTALACLRLDVSTWHGVLGFPHVCASVMRATVRVSAPRDVSNTAAITNVYVGMGLRVGLEARVAPFFSVAAHTELRGTVDRVYTNTSWASPPMSADVAIGGRFRL